METKKNNILDFLSEKNVIEIPIWHREYVWTQNPIIQLYEDLESIINSPNIPSHFLGIVVHKLSNTAFSKTELIDGQQRLVTISLLLCAICDHFKAEKYKTALLFIPHTAQPTSKIKRLNKVKDELENILLNQDFAYMENSIFSQYYRYFLDKIETNHYSLEDYFNALKKFEIVELLITEKDNPQLIFDSLNSIGTKLNNFEKIKNYVFMGLDIEEQSLLWNKYWNTLENLFNKNEELFNEFMVSYISMQTEQTSDYKNLSVAFNKFYNFKRKYKKATDIIAELSKFAQYFIRIKNADFSEDIATYLEKIVEIYDKPELYSFLFEITDDFQNNLIPKKTYIDILINTYTYLKISSDKKEKVSFSKLSKNISKMLTQKYNQGT